MSIYAVFYIKLIKNIGKCPNSKGLVSAALDLGLEIDKLKNVPSFMAKFLTCMCCRPNGYWVCHYVQAWEDIRNIVGLQCNDSLAAFQNNFLVQIFGRPSPRPRL